LIDLAKRKLVDRLSYLPEEGPEKKDLGGGLEKWHRIYWTDAPLHRGGGAGISQGKLKKIPIDNKNAADLSLILDESDEHKRAGPGRGGRRGGLSKRNRITGKTEKPTTKGGGPSLRKGCRKTPREPRRQKLDRPESPFGAGVV